MVATIEMFHYWLLIQITNQVGV